MLKIGISLLMLLVLLGCAAPLDNPELRTPQPLQAPSQETHAYPTVSATLSPANPALWESFTLTVTAQDDTGVRSISWQSTPSLPAESFDCSQQKTCTHTWDLVAAESGTYQFLVTVEDILGKTIENSLEASVAAPVDSHTAPPAPPSPPPAEPEEPAHFFTCGNSVCEGGESYESCPNDCTQQDIVGTNPGNGACEPGEDVNNAPKDCTVINKQCGNNVCDAGEDRLNCYYDCWNEGESTGEACSSDSDCGYKQECKSGKCYSVECTSDYHCKGCARCSDNQCVPCGYGVQGYCTC